MGPWSNLPVDLLNVIEDHIVLYADKIRIRAVCLPWNIYLPKLINNQAKKLPWLLHPLANNTEASHGLFNPIDKKVYDIYVPELKGKLFKGSSYGWVVTAEDNNSANPTAINLINPLTRARILLPPRTEFPDVVKYRPDQVDEEYIVRRSYDLPPNRVIDREEYPVEFFESALSSYDLSVWLTVKVVLTSAPSDECVVVALYGEDQQLAWCRCNDKKWTHIYGGGILAIIDIIYHKGKLYALKTDPGEIFVFENIGSNDVKVRKIWSEVPIPFGRTVHMAECSDGSLVVVHQHFDQCKTGTEEHDFARTIGFNVYKFDSLNSNWFEVKEIGGDVLFLGLNSAKLVSSLDLPGYLGNCIYFSDGNGRFTFLPEENEKSDGDIGVFNLENGSLESLPGLHQPMWPRAIWINVS